VKKFTRSVDFPGQRAKKTDQIVGHSISGMLSLGASWIPDGEMVARAFKFPHYVLDTSPAALGNMRRAQAGETCVIYHTGDERTSVGLAKVLSVVPSNPKVPVVRIKYVKRLKTPHTLSEIKANKLFVDSPLINQGRLSVVPLTAAQYAWLTGE